MARPARCLGTYFQTAGVESAGLFGLADLVDASSCYWLSTGQSRNTIHIARFPMLVARVVVALAWILGAGSLLLFGGFLWT